MHRLHAYLTGEGVAGAVLRREAPVVEAVEHHFRELPAVGDAAGVAGDAVINVQALSGGRSSCRQHTVFITCADYPTSTRGVGGMLSCFL